MAFPSVLQASTWQKDDANASSFEVSRPAGLTNGNLLMVLFVCDGDSLTIDLSTDGLTHVSATYPGGGVSIRAGYREIDGTEPTTFTCTTSSAQRACAVVYEISGWDTAVAPDLPILAKAGGTSATPNPPENDQTTADDFLWVAFAGVDRDRTIDSFPANMDTGTSPQNKNGGGANSCSVGTQTHQENISAFNPGTFGISASDEWVVWTIAVTPAGGPTTGVGDSAGTSTVTGVGQDATPKSPGTAAGTSTATGDGASKVAQPGTSAGTSTVTGDGVSTVEANGSAAGTSTVSGAGLAKITAVGDSAGTSTVTAAGISTFAADGSSAGVATVTADGVSTAVADGAAAGTSTVTGVVAVVVTGVGSSAGVATVTGDGVSTAAADGSSAGAATTTSIGASTMAGDGSSVGVATVTAGGVSTFRADGSSASMATVTAAGAATAAAAGLAAAAAIVAAAPTVFGLSAGVATVTGDGASTMAGDGVAAGTSTVTAVGQEAPFIIDGTGLAAGTVTVTAKAATSWLPSTSPSPAVWTPEETAPVNI